MSVTEIQITVLVRYVTTTTKKKVTSFRVIYKRVGVPIVATNMGYI